MRLKRVLFVLILLLVCAWLPRAAADTVTFTGDADADFPVTTQWAVDDRGDSKGPGACLDQPLGADAYTAPPITPIPATGFNVERVGTLYDCATDTLYVALDICDDRIAWDADADGRITKFDPSGGVPGAQLAEGFRDDGLEDYEIELDVGNGSLATPFVADMKIFVQSIDGGVNVSALSSPLPAGVTFSVYTAPRTPIPPAPPDYQPTEKDIEVQINGLRAAFSDDFPNMATLPVRIATRSGATGDLVNEDITDAVFNLTCEPEITITKGVSCVEGGPFGPSVTVLRGETTYFRITVQNTGNEPLGNVVISDLFTSNGACCPAGSCIPTEIVVGNLAVGETRNFDYTVPTDPTFNITGETEDCVNVASVVGVGVYTGVGVNAGPARATVNVLVPSITCEKLVDDDDNPDPSQADDPGLAPSHELNLTSDGVDTEQVWYWICLRNNGETDVDFEPIDARDCPSISDSLLDSPIAGVTVPAGTDVGQAFRDALQTKYGSLILEAGDEVCVAFGPVMIDEQTLCPDTPYIENTFSACGLALGTCLADGQGEEVNTSCTARVDICPPKICIEKTVACSLDGPFTNSVTALRGATVYFKIDVTNCGGEDLRDVVVTDTLTDDNGALLPCQDCTNTDSCIPGVINIGDLPVGETKTFICTVQTNPAFAVTGLSPDATNTAGVVGIGVASERQVEDGPVSATVDVLVPGIACNKLVDNDSNPVPGAPDADGAQPTAHLNLVDGILGTKQAWYYLYVENTGEVDVDFAAGADPGCPSFTDAFLEGSRAGITGLNQDLDAAFRAALQTKYGSHVMPVGGDVYVTVGPVSFNETALCGDENVFPDTFTACGIATDPDICLPESGGEVVTTGECEADVTICPGPCITITKEVSCDPLEGFGPSVTALRGADVYFKIVVTNCGGEDLLNVEITDTIEDANGALLPCEDCTNTDACIPGTISIDILPVGDSRTFVCKVPTNPAFDTADDEADAVNTAMVTATAERSGTTLTLDPVSAEVHVLVPSISCVKLVDDDENPDPEAADDTPPTTDLDLAYPPMGVKQAWYWLCVENNGQVDVDFTERPGEDCPYFRDDFLEIPFTLDGHPEAQIPGTGIDLDALFRAELQSKFGGLVLPAGQKVCIATPAVSFNEDILCRLGLHEFPDTFSACGIATQDDICLPEDGGEVVTTGECDATVRICPACIDIVKLVACTPEGPFLPSVTVPRGSTVYFQVAVTNCGGDDLTDVEIQDSLTGDACCPTGACIPSVIEVGNLAVGETKTYTYPVQTDENFASQNTSPDCTNTATATGTGVNTGLHVEDGPAIATVDVVVPIITCELMLDDDAVFTEEPGEVIKPAHNLLLNNNGPMKIEQVWCKLSVTNNGEVDVDFPAGPNADCPTFRAPFLTTPNADIPGTGVDIVQAFRDALAVNNYKLPPHETVEIVVGPMMLDESMLCPFNNHFKLWFDVCGIAGQEGVCGTTVVSTERCDGSIAICEPVLFQAYPGDSNGANVHYSGYLGQGGETISAVPGVFVLAPGDRWENFVTAAQAGIAYTLKNVTLIKETPTFIQCDDVFTSMVVKQQGTAGIRLRWPLMYEAPGTRWTLTIQYGTSIPWDDDGIDGPHVAGYNHEDEWSWKVDASLHSMKLLLELFHEVPFATDEVPLISDEELYPELQARLDQIIALWEDGNTREAALALGDFEMVVSDACIPVSPRHPYPAGPGTGIAQTDENPACCKILVDAEYVGFKLGLFQAAK